MRRKMEKLRNNFLVKGAKKHPSAYTFAKAQLSAFLGGVIDYLVMIFITEVLGIFYSISIIISGLLGAIANFSLNRYWAFKSTEASTKAQLHKFIFVVLGSVALKSSGTFLFTETLQIDYKITRLMVDAIVSIGFNFTLQKFWVFKK
jgi:putative flippase GtrA